MVDITQGRFIAVVGPSGVGKDSIIDGLCAADPALIRCRRVITRARGAGGEDFEAVDEQTFAARAGAGEFVLWWRAHGLSYGIPRAITWHLDAGRDVVANLSRTILSDAAEAVPSLIVFNITASPEVLAHRLAGRGRETSADIASRLARTTPSFPDHVRTITISNDGPLAETIARARDALTTEMA